MPGKGVHLDLQKLSRAEGSRAVEAHLAGYQEVQVHRRGMFTHKLWCNEDLQVSAKIEFDLKVTNSGLKVTISEFRVTISEFKVTISGVRVTFSGLKVTFSGVRVTFKE